MLHFKETNNIEPKGEGKAELFTDLKDSKLVLKTDHLNKHLQFKTYGTMVVNCQPDLVYFV